MLLGELGEWVLAALGFGSLDDLWFWSDFWGSLGFCLGSLELELLGTFGVEVWS